MHWSGICSMGARWDAEAVASWMHRNHASDTDAVAMWLLYGARWTADDVADWLLRDDGAGWDAEAVARWHLSVIVAREV